MTPKKNIAIITLCFFLIILFVISIILTSENVKDNKNIKNLNREISDLQSIIADLKSTTIPTPTSITRFVPGDEPFGSREYWVKRFNLEDCYETELNGAEPEPIKVYTLNDKKLAEVVCTVASYQASFFYVYYSDTLPYEDAKLLTFETYQTVNEKVEKGETNFVIGVGYQYDENTGELISFTKGRGLADCGVESSYQFENGEFILKNVTEKAECDGDTQDASKWKQIYP